LLSARNAKTTVVCFQTAGWVETPGQTTWNVDVFIQVVKDMVSKNLSCVVLLYSVTLTSMDLEQEIEFTLTGSELFLRELVTHSFWGLVVQQ
jgi:hypothetical protein